MPHPYTQLTIVNVVLGAAAAVVVLGAPIVPAAIGAIGTGVLLLVGHRLCEWGKDLGKPRDDSPRPLRVATDPKPLFGTASREPGIMRSPRRS